MCQKSTFSGKSGNSGKIRKIYEIPKFFLINVFITSKYTSCPNLTEKLWFLKKLGHFQFYEDLTVKKPFHKYDDVIEGHVIGYKDQFFLIEAIRILGILKKGYDEKNASSP